MGFDNIITVTCLIALMFKKLSFLITRTLSLYMICYSSAYWKCIFKDVKKVDSFLAT